MAQSEAILASAEDQKARRSTESQAGAAGGQTAVKPGKPQKDNEKAAYEFSNLNQAPKVKAPADMDFILDVPLEISVELGKTRLQINELLKLSQGSIIELTKNAGESLEILANRRLIARGEVVVANEKYGIRVTEIISPMERVEKLK